MNRYVVYCLWCNSFIINIVIWSPLIIYIPRIIGSLHIVASAPKGEDYGLATVSIDQTIPLSGYIQPDAVTSEYENGILTIKAPRENIAAAKGVKVPVK
jgi:hypothetical protein